MTAGDRVFVDCGYGIAARLPFGSARCGTVLSIGPAGYVRVRFDGGHIANFRDYFVHPIDSEAAQMDLGEFAQTLWGYFQIGSGVT